MRDLFSFAQIYPRGMKYNRMHEKKTIEGKELFITNFNPFKAT
jgi:hypothetical protein